MMFQIKNRFTAAVQFECNMTAEVAGQSYHRQLGFAVKKAVEAYADLAGANLADVDLAGANLADVDLVGADLAGAHLAGADLVGANLAYADLVGADLVDANLAGADLGGANLAGANLVDADLGGADLAGANLADVDLAGADLVDARNVPASVQATSPAEPYVRMADAKTRAERMQRFRERNPEVPVIEALDAKILAAVTSWGHLDMSSWHKCKTTHCRAGWAITLAGEAGKALEEKHGPQRAGTMIYRASTGHVPYFFASTEVAMTDIKRCAEQET
jgi:hypothetical protein